MNIKLTIHLLLAIFILTATSTAWGQACMRSSDFMELSCRHEAKEEFWVNFANCKNLRETRDILDCYTESFDIRDEVLEECGELKESRNTVCDLIGDDRYHPVINPDNFMSIDEAVANPNPFFPLIPGTITRYEVTEEEDSEPDQTGLLAEREITELITVTVTDETREILGVECFIVNDVVTDPEGEVIEDTDDYYAVDKDNNVWYFGEIAKNFEDGFLTDLDGSFVAGEDGAKPGIIMLASPMAGDAYRQEFALGEAEDYAVVLSLAGDESSPIADCNGACLQVNDLNAQEPDADEDKFYKAGIGAIVEVDNVGTERVDLVEIINPD